MRSSEQRRADLHNATMREVLNWTVSNNADEKLIFKPATPATGHAQLQLVIT